MSETVPRMLEIKSCYECPYVGRITRRCSLTAEMITPFAGIPDYCPLPKKEEKQED